MAGIDISFLADVSQFLRGTRDVEGSLDDVSDALDDVARDARRTGDDVEGSLDDVSDALDDVARDARRTGDDVGDNLTEGARTAEDAAARMEREFRDSLDGVRDRSKKAGDDVGDNMKKGADKGVDAAAEFKSEAVQNFSEVASSFEGDMTSAVDLVQGTLGGLAGSIPGVGIALAGVGAVAGVVASQWQESTEQSKERVAAMYDDMLESGADYLSQSLIHEQVSAIIKEEEDAVAKLAEVQKIAAATGLEQAVVLRALAGDSDAHRVVSEALADQLADLTEQSKEFLTENGQLAVEARGAAAALGEQITANRDLQSIMGRTSGEFQKATEQVDLARAATSEWADTVETLPRDVAMNFSVIRDEDGERIVRETREEFGRPIRPYLDLSQAEDELRRWHPEVRITPRIGTRVV